MAKDTASDNSQESLFSDEDVQALRSSLDASGGVVPDPDPDDAGAAHKDPASEAGTPPQQTPDQPAQQAQQETGDQPSTPPAEQAETTQEVLGIRDAAKEFGIDLSAYDDDSAALKALAEQAQQAKQASELAQYGQEFVRHAADGTWQQYLQWKQEQEKQQQTEADQPLLWRSEWDPAWAALLTTDENGNIVPDTSKGGTPDLVQKYYKHQQQQLDVLNKLASNPEAALDPYVQNRAEKIARQIVQEELGKFASQQEARDFVIANDWLWEDKAKRKLSDEGKVFADAYQKIDDDPDFSGLTQKGKEKLAMQALDQYRAKKQADEQPTPEDKQRETLQRAAGYQPSSGASTRPANQARAEEHEQDENASFREMLQAAMKAAGHEATHDLVKA